METKSIKRIKALQNQLDLKRKTELVAQEEKKNAFLATIISNHEKTFEEMKKYYTDITATNLKLITELKVVACHVVVVVHLACCLPIDVLHILKAIIS